MMDGAFLDCSNLDIGMCGPFDTEYPSSLEEVSLKSAHMYKTNLCWANLHRTDLTGAYCKEAIFDCANLSNSLLRGCKLMGASLRNTNLKNEDLSFAHLDGADLRGTNLQYSNLTGTKLISPTQNLPRFIDQLRLEQSYSGAIFNDSTIWPLGFNPIESGAV